MRTKTIVIIFGCLLISGCGTKCDGYAPSEISWTDYNTVEKVRNYFKYKHTGEAHREDTVRICGYIIGNGDTGYYRSKYENAEHSHICVDITDDSLDTYRLPRGGKMFMCMCGLVDKMEWLKDYQTGQKVYVTGFCHTLGYVVDICTCGTQFYIENVSLNK